MLRQWLKFVFKTASSRIIEFQLESETSSSCFAILSISEIENLARALLVWLESIQYFLAANTNSNHSVWYCSGSTRITGCQMLWVMERWGSRLSVESWQLCWQFPASGKSECCWGGDGLCGVSGLGSAVFLAGTASLWKPRIFSRGLKDTVPSSPPSDT